MSQDELAAILMESQKNNRELGITGMLMYSQGTYIQALEGDEKAVKDVYDIIQKDDRHKNVIELASGPLEERVFPEWSMAFIAPDPEKMHEIDGYTNPLHKQLFNEDNDHTILNVLRTFADNNNFNL